MRERKKGFFHHFIGPRNGIASVNERIPPQSGPWKTDLNSKLTGRIPCVNGIHDPFPNVLDDHGVEFIVVVNFDALLFCQATVAKPRDFDFFACTVSAEIPAFYGIPNLISKFWRPTKRRGQHVSWRFSPSSGLPQRD